MIFFHIFAYSFRLQSSPAASGVSAAGYMESREQGKSSNPRGSGEWDGIARQPLLPMQFIANYLINVRGQAATTL